MESRECARMYIYDSLDLEDMVKANISRRDSLEDGEGGMGRAALGWQGRNGFRHRKANVNHSNKPDINKFVNVLNQWGVSELFADDRRSPEQLDGRTSPPRGSDPSCPFTPDGTAGGRFSPTTNAGGQEGRVGGYLGEVDGLKETAERRLDERRTVEISPIPTLPRSQHAGCWGSSRRWPPYLLHSHIRPRRIHLPGGLAADDLHNGPDRRFRLGRQQDFGHPNGRQRQSHTKRDASIQTDDVLFLTDWEQDQLLSDSENELPLIEFGR